MASVAVFLGIAVAALALGSRRVRRSTAWRATVTPLASIIGSGFLVLAPLLAVTVGEWAPAAMIAIVVLAYAIGATIRFNIAHAEALLDSGGAPRILIDLERVSRLLLGLAYMISVAFYLRLLASFVLDALGLQSALGGRISTTVALAAIAGVGWFRGLHGIEAFEIPAVDVKLVVIAGLLGALAVYATTHPGAAVDAYSSFPIHGDGLTLARKLAGMLLVVQGFETSRYLGRYYDSELRVRTMRVAQLVSGAVYVIFAILIVPVFGHLGSGSRETAIIDAARFVTPVLVPLLFLAAVASQLSAAAADTAGGSEMITERARHEPGNLGYIVVAAGAGAVVWATDVFGIISLASRAFAAYYLCQALIAARVATLGRRRNRRLVAAANVALAAVLLGVTILALPGE
jgi:hypothetical protein